MATALDFQLMFGVALATPAAQERMACATGPASEKMAIAIATS